MANTATRLITLIMLLQRQPNQKAAALAEELGVSVRSLHRYMAMLDEIGIPIYSERGPYGGFSLVRGYRLPPLVFSPEEATAVCLGTSLVEELWGQLYRQPARGALAKLENVLPDEQRREVAWARRTLWATGMHRADIAALAPVLETLRQAAREHRRVRLSYQGRSRQELTERDLDTYGLVHRAGWWYVVGYCHLRGEVRTFRVDRIARIGLQDVVFDPPAGFDLQGYLASEFQAQPQITARLRFAPAAAHVAHESRPAWETLAEQADGSVVVTFSAPDLDWAASMALSFGALVEVLEPAGLRLKVAEWAAAVAQTYR